MQALLQCVSQARVEIDGHAAGRGARLHDYFVAQARAAHPLVQTGQFAADMQVHPVNDGPVTVPIRMPPRAHDSSPMHG